MTKYSPFRGKIQATGWDKATQGDEVGVRFVKLSRIKCLDNCTNSVMHSESPNLSLICTESI